MNGNTIEKRCIQKTTKAKKNAHASCGFAAYTGDFENEEKNRDWARGDGTSIQIYDDLHVFLD